MEELQNLKQKRSLCMKSFTIDGLGHQRVSFPYMEYKQRKIGLKANYTSLRSCRVLFSIFL